MKYNFNYYHKKKYGKTRQEVIEEKPKLTDWGSPYHHQFSNRNPFLIICFIFGLVIRLWILKHWDSYDDLTKEELKTDYFFYFWIRTYKNKKDVDNFKTIKK